MFYVRFKKKKKKKLLNRLFLLISSFLVSDVSELLISLKSNEQCEQIAHFAHQKGANERVAQKNLAKKILFYYVLWFKKKI